MRVSSLRDRIADEERGAVLAMVAISLFVLLGMLVLTFDLGRSVAIKRKMVNGTDAAALAAAQQCALGNGSAAAQSAAATVLASNEGSAGVTSFSAPQCNSPASLGPKTVTVTSSTSVEYYFAQIFGFESGSVAARAVAIWAPVPNARPVPITVDHNQLTSCSIPVTVPPDGGSIPCNLQFPKDALSEPRWGTLDLSKWGDPNAAPCHVSAETLQGLIDAGGWPTPLPLNGDPQGTEPTYDCLDNGLSFSVWDSMVGKTLTFPVIDIPTSYGAGCAGTDPDCTIETANVVSFVTLKVNSVVNDGSTVRLETEWFGPDIVPGEMPGDGIDFGNRTIRLVD